MNSTMAVTTAAQRHSHILKGCCKLDVDRHNKCTLLACP